MGDREQKMRNIAFSAIAILWTVLGIVLLYTMPEINPSQDKAREDVPAKIPAAVAGDDQLQPPMPGVWDFRDFLNAIEQEESHGDPNAVGKDGERGVYQIGRDYWIDGKGGDYETGVLDKDVCEQVMWNYWSRHCPEALYELDYETLARIHVGGPRGESKESTKPYWNKIKKELAKTARKR